jgi:hypothetical protein
MNIKDSKEYNIESDKDIKASGIQGEKIIGEKLALFALPIMFIAVFGAVFNHVLPFVALYMLITIFLKDICNVNLTYVLSKWSYGFIHSVYNNRELYK